MNRRLVIAGVASAAIVGAVVPAFAQSGDSTATLPVTVTHDTSNGVAVGVWIQGRPGVAASVTPTGKACVGISLQLPVCADAGAVVDTIDRSVSVGSLPVTVTHDTSNGVSVGTAVGNQPLVGASVSPNGEACVGFSYEIPACVGGINPNKQTRQKLPLPQVVAQHDENGTAVGVDDVGVRIDNNGRICPVVSTQTWQCIGGDN